MNKILIYQTKGNKTEIEVRFEKGTVWLNRRQIGTLFGRDVKTIGKHINNVFREGELDRSPVVAKFATTASDGKNYQVEHYNLDVIISVGYRVKSLQGTQFRIWATGRLKDYLVQGYAINEKRLQQKNQQVQYLKTGIRILSRAIEEQAETSVNRIMKYFAEGLSLLDRYDNGQLDVKGRTIKKAVYPDYDEYMVLINGMEPEFHSALFGRARDDSFKSSIYQIAQAFDGKDLYLSIEEKAAILLYLIVKNHSFVDGNKRIAAACFILFLHRNNRLKDETGEPSISNEALAALTLFIASSKPEEMETVKQLIISILN